MLCRSVSAVVLHLSDAYVFFHVRDCWFLYHRGVVAGVHLRSTGDDHLAWGALSDVGRIEICEHKGVAELALRALRGKGTKRR